MIPGITASRRRVNSGSDPYWGNVSLLLHCEGSDGATTFIDSSSNPKIVTANGSAKVSTARSKFGAASASIPTASFLGIPNESSLYPAFDKDFTIEAQVYVPAGSLGGYLTIAGLSSTKTGYNRFLLDVTPNRNVRFALYDGVSEKVAATANNTVSGDMWLHVAGVKSGSSIFAFANGVKGATVATVGANFPTPTGRVAIGRIGEYAGGNLFNGHIDEIRITQGVARYTDSFTPPAAPFPNS